MANLNKSKTLFAFTSPRTIEKIIPEIRLLGENFEGKQWNTQTQVTFFRNLFSSAFYEGKSMPSNISFAARDRITRAPKSLGFVDLKPQIKVTEIGKVLLTEKRINETFTRQLLKFQLPSPYHKSSTDLFFVKPYLEFLRLLSDLDYLTKYETAIFFLQLTHINSFIEIRTKIKKFRGKLKTNTSNRKRFIDDCFNDEIRQLYKDEIGKNNFKTRESDELSLKKFIRTKKSNMLDYADAFIRYMRATSLITYESKTYRIIIAPFKKEEVCHILNTIPRKPKIFTNESKFKKYLFSASNLSLLNDSAERISHRLKKLGITCPTGMDIEGMKDIIESEEKKIRDKNIDNTVKSLKNNYDDYEDVKSTFIQITNREVPDPSLYLEWNVWRAMTMLDDAVKINGNFSFDLDGIPLSNAKGNVPDIEVEYEDFNLIVEVTMSSGNTQYNMEGEPVARHFGMAQQKSDKKVFCLFVAPNISNGALAHFYNLNRMNTKAYGGKTRIVPINLNQFIRFIERAKLSNFCNQKDLYGFFDSAIQKIQDSENEELWFKSIDESISKWGSSAKL